VTVAATASSTSRRSRLPSGVNHTGLAADGAEFCPVEFCPAPINPANCPNTIAAARRTVPGLSDQQWLAWLTYVEAHGGVLALPVDGGPCFAEYPRPSSPARQQCCAITTHQDPR
jgi:hypothetical protein